jgi:hypothetical protein
VELAEANQKTYDEAAREAEKADKELAANNEKEAGSNSDPKETREETVTPDPAKTPAGQGAKGTTAATKSSTTSTNK